MGGRSRSAAARRCSNAVLAAGVELPHLCKDEDGPALGACRTCLVEIDGVRGLPASCSLPAAQGMAVRTAGDVADARPPRHPEAHAGHARRRRRPPARLRPEPRGRHPRRRRPPLAAAGQRRPRRQQPLLPLRRGRVHPLRTLHVGLPGPAEHRRDRHRRERQARRASPPSTTSRWASRSARRAGQCVAACPTGSIRPKREPAPARTVSTVCPYCGVGCGIKLSADEEGRITHVDDDPANRSSTGLLCVKGRFGVSFVDHPDRLTTPLVRPRGPARSAGWDEALDLVADKFVQHRGRFGAFASAKATNEDNYLIQKFTRTLMATNNIDHCTRLCHSPLGRGDAGPAGQRRDVKLLHGLRGRRLRFRHRGRPLLEPPGDRQPHPARRGGARRAPDRARPAAGRVLRPHRPLAAPLSGDGRRGAQRHGPHHPRRRLQNEAFIRDRTEGFDAWRAGLEAYTPEHVEDLSGVPADLLRRAARLYARPAQHGGPPAATAPACSGAWALPSTSTAPPTRRRCSTSRCSPARWGGPAPACPRCAVRTTCRAPAMRAACPTRCRAIRTTRPPTWPRFEGAWGSALTPEQGMRATDMGRPSPRATSAACTSWARIRPSPTPNLAHATELLRSLDFLVVQDLFMHETAEIADVVLPAASFAEKEGTFTNSERRVQRVRKLVEPPGRRTGRLGDRAGPGGAGRGPARGRRAGPRPAWLRSSVGPPRSSTSSRR